MQHIPGPDFPTAGIINGSQEIAPAYLHRPRPRCTCARAPTIEEDDKGRQAIIITELPYPGEQGAAARAHRRAGAREGHRRHRERRPARRVRQGRHARRHRAQARRGRRHRAEQPVQAHADGVGVRHQHGRAAGRPAEAASTSRRCSRRSCAIAARSSRGARSTICARRASAPTSSKARRSRSRTSTRSSRSSRRRRRRPRPRSR